jgi:hypothetical protein
MSKINNEWITLTEKRNGVDVQRKFAGLDTFIDTENNVLHCFVKYWERELYPNGEVIKIEQKFYSLENLKEFTNENESFKMAELNVLNGFINSLGYSGIINPARATLASVDVLKLNVDSGYPLHRDTREKLPL